MSDRVTSRDLLNSINRIAEKKIEADSGQAELQAEIDRLRANEDSLCEKIRALTDENKRLRAEKEWK